MATNPLRNLLASSGYSVHFRSDLWTECFASHEKERWRGRGLDEHEALEDVVRQMFPSALARQLLDRVTTEAPPSEPAAARMEAPPPPAEVIPPEAPPPEPAPLHESEAAPAPPEEAAPPADPLPEPAPNPPVDDRGSAPNPPVDDGGSAPNPPASERVPVSVRSASIVIAARSNRGLVRERDEGACLAFPERGLIAIADGLGPHPGADLPATLAIETLRKAFANDAPLSPVRRKGLALLVAAIEAANAAIVDVGKHDRAQRGKGTTLAAALVVGRQVALAHVGDSRIYRLRRGVLELLTTDHTRTNDRLRATSKTAPPPASSLSHPGRPRTEVTRALGARRAVEPDTSVVTSQAGDVLLLCTAGLHRIVAHPELTAVLVRHADPADAVEQLVARANAAGGPDNVTAAVVRWER